MKLSQIIIALLFSATACVNSAQAADTDTDAKEGDKPSE